MAKSPTTQIHELALEFRTALERIDTLVRDSAQSTRERDELWAIVDRQREELAATRRENALLTQRLEIHLKQVETWSGRVWGLVSVLVGAVFSLASGLIVTLARK